MVAPRSNAATAAPTEPRTSSRWSPRDRRAPCRACSSARARRAPDGRAPRVRRARAAAARFWSGVLPKPMPGIEADIAPRGSRARRRTRGAPRETRPPPRRRPSYRGATCIVRGSPCMCIRQRYAPAPATTPAMPGSPRRAVTSLTSSAPSSSARRATSAFEVSIDTGRPRSSSSTGTTRRSSSSSETAAAPGRVDSPPTSTIAAPSASIARPRRRRVLGRREAPAVGEAVRRDVDDAHDRRPGQTLFEWRSSHLTVDRSGMSGTGRLAAVLLTVTVLLGAVIVAARRRDPGRQRRLARAARSGSLDVFVSLLLVQLAFGARPVRRSPRPAAAGAPRPVGRAQARTPAGRC